MREDRRLREEVLDAGRERAVEEAQEKSRDKRNDDHDDRERERLLARRPADVLELCCSFLDVISECHDMGVFWE